MKSKVVELKEQLLMPDVVPLVAEQMAVLAPVVRSDWKRVAETVPVVLTPAQLKEKVVESYKSLSGVERAFRSLKTVDLQVRPIHHRLPDRVRAHILLCVLAYYVEWHMRQLLAPILFDDDDKPQAQAARTSVVAPAQRSTSAKLKALTKQAADGTKIHSFQTLLGDLATIVKNRIQPTDKSLSGFDMLTQPTVIQQCALDLLGLTLRP